MKRILFITTRPELGGAQKWTHDQMELLEGRFDLYLSTGEEGWLTKKLKLSCKDILIDKKLYKYTSISYLIRLLMFVRKNRIDIVVASSANAGVYARLLKIFFPKLSIVYVSHGWSAIYRGNSMFQAVEKMLSYLSTSILAISKSDYHKAVDILKIHPEKVVLIENSIYPYNNFTGISRQKDSKNITIVMVARFEYPKRQDLLIEAAKRLPDIQFQLVGEGKNLESCKKDAPSNVHFLKASTNIEEVLRGADIFALLSESEGMPISVLEALACEKPILLSQVSSMGTFVRENGLLVGNDVNEVVTAIKKLGELDFDSMGKASLELFNDRFNLLNNKERYIHFYKSLDSEQNR